MFQDLFLQMNQTLDQLEQEFDSVNDVDEELSLLEKYLSIKEISEDITYELKNLNYKIQKFEEERGLTDLSVFDDETQQQNDDEVVIELDESDFLAFQKGIGFFDLWMYDEAIIHLEKIITKYPDFNLARLYTAMTYFKKKEYSEARHEVLTMLKLSDDPALISLGHNILGMVYSFEQNYDQAIIHFHKAIDIKDNWNEPRFNLAIIFYKLKRYNEAINLLEGLYNNNPKDWEAILFLGKAYHQLQQFKKANEYFKKSYSITRQPFIIKQIADYFEKRRNFQQAAYWYKKWLNIELKNPEAMIGLAKTLYLSGDKKTGVLLLKKTLSITPENTEVLIMYAWMLTEERDNKALIIMDKIATVNDNTEKFSSYLIANLARLYYINYDLKKADLFCTKLLNSNHHMIRAIGHVVQGLIHLDKKEPQLAIFHIEKSVEEGIKFPYSDFYIGYSHYLLGDLEQAKFFWTKLLV